MRDILNSNVLGNIEVEAQKKIRHDINERWDKLGFCKGLEGHLKETIATLYESQARHLIYETTGADNSGSFETVVFPLIRRTFSKLLVNDIAAVHAMNLPIGKLFFFKPVTSEREWSAQVLNDGVTGKHPGLQGYARTQRHTSGTVNAGDKKARFFLPDDVIAPGQKLPQMMKKNLYDLFYDDFLFDNSKGKITIKVGSAKPVVLGNDGEFTVAPSMATYPVDGNDGSLSKVLLEVTGFSSYNAGRLTGPDGNEMDSESFLASLKVIANQQITGAADYTTFEEGESILYRVVTQKYGHQMVDYGNNICDAKGKIYLELDLRKPCKKQGKTLDGFIGIDPTVGAALVVDNAFKIAWAQYDSLELETEMGEVGFQLTSETVSVEERKLRASWSPEQAQDVAAFHNIDAEAEITAILAEQIGAEIDREVLRDIRSASPWKARWDYNGWQRLNTTSTVYTQKDWNQTLMTKINQISAQIQKSTLRGGANWIVVSAEISAVLNDLEYFHVTDASAESDQYNMGIEKIGSLQGRYKVIVDPWAPHWSLIMGHHGTSLLDTGYIYAPYVPMVLTPLMINPFNAAPIKAICTRYAKKMVNNRYYGSIKVDGLTYWNVSELR